MSKLKGESAEHPQSSTSRFMLYGNIVKTVANSKATSNGEVLAKWLESRNQTRNRKVVSSSLGPAGTVGGESEQGTEPPTAPWAPQHN